MDLRPFDDALASNNLYPLSATCIDTLQINLGRLCNLRCKHCHVDAGPEAGEVMSRETMQVCLDRIAGTEIKTVDITGGAPEMNPHFRWFVEACVRTGRHVMVRSNLAILTEPRYEDLPEFFAAKKVEVIASLPHYLEQNTDNQRGKGVFERIIGAIKRLNSIGYGDERSGLMLNLVYNPGGAFLPASQGSLSTEFRKELERRHGIRFNDLYTITNMPIGRFREFLDRSGNYERYMMKLVSSFNPDAAANAMCRRFLSVGWDGSLYDCDFNQMLGLKVSGNVPSHIREFNQSSLGRRKVVTGIHCYGCTAGSGSSCGGSTA